MNGFQYYGRILYPWCLLLLLLSVHVSLSESQDPKLKLINGATEKGAVCLDGSPPGYYFSPGFGSGVKNWMVYVEGGAWCKSDRDCANRAKTYLGSTRISGTRGILQNAGILSNDPGVNPDFYNWNVAWLRYCDGASFLGNREAPVVISKDLTIYYRGARIWDAVIEDLMASGMAGAEKRANSFRLCAFRGNDDAADDLLERLNTTMQKALLTGCSAGGLTTILRCDSFKGKLPATTSVKCLADAGFFLNVPDVGGGQTSVDLFRGAALTHEVMGNLPKGCTASRPLNAQWECIFAQNALPYVQTPLYILQSGIDYWQIQNLVGPKSADPSGEWQTCSKNLASCSSKQINVIQDFRDSMVEALGNPAPGARGEFVISCYAHCMALDSKRWSSHSTFTINDKTMQQSVGDWFNANGADDILLVDGPYLSNPTCGASKSSADTIFAEHLDISFDD